MVATGRIVALGGAGGLLAILVGVLVHGAGVEGWSAATRWTARWSLIPFAMTFAAGGLLPRTRGRCRAILSNRRGLGLAFALAHGLHALCIATYFTVSAERVPIVALIGGGIGYALILAMVVTSTDAAQRALGRGWKQLHRLGLWYVFLIFTQSYAGRLVAFGEHRAAGLYGVAVLLLALALRVAPGPQPAYVAERRQGFAVATRTGRCTSRSASILRMGTSVFR